MILIIIAAVIAAVCLYLTAPKKAEKGEEIFTGRAFAHRGLYDNEAGIPENSAASFRRAVENGFGCELDVQLTKDEKLVVFHDDTLDRACGVSGLVREKSFEEIRSLRLFGTDEIIPTFEEVLGIVDGKIPLIVELKSELPDKALNVRNCEITCGMLSAYKGQYCIESFDPTIVGWFRKNAPDIIRGQLSMAPDKYPKSYSIWLKLLLGYLGMNFLGRPNFIAYDVESAQPVTLKMCKALGAFHASWTCREPEKHEMRIKDGQAVIFEKYIPGN